MQCEKSCGVRVPVGREGCAARRRGRGRPQLPLHRCPHMGWGRVGPVVVVVGRVGVQSASAAPSSCDATGGGVEGNRTREAGYWWPGGGVLRSRCRSGRARQVHDALVKLPIIHRTAARPIHSLCVCDGNGDNTTCLVYFCEQLGEKLMGWELTGSERFGNMLALLHVAKHMLDDFDFFGLGFESGFWL